RPRRAERQRLHRPRGHPLQRRRPAGGEPDPGHGHQLVHGTCHLLPTDDRQPDDHHDVGYDFHYDDHEAADHHDADHDHHDDDHEAADHHDAGHDHHDDDHARADHLHDPDDDQHDVAAVAVQRGVPRVPWRLPRGAGL